MHVHVETPRLILRRATSDDLDDLVDLTADPEVMRYINGGEAIPRERVAEVTLPAWLDYYERGSGYGTSIAIDRATGEFLGWFRLKSESGQPADDPELDYRLRRSAWGNGYATEAAIALVDRAFGVLGARQVLSATYSQNLASRRVLEKAGMQLIRTYRLTPEEVVLFGYGDPATYYDIFPEDEVDYAITREKWERSVARLG